jgi:hypothetical protein
VQRNSRIGGTVSLPIKGQHSVKFNVSTGAVTNIGADFVSFGASYQFLWGAGL